MITKCVYDSWVRLHFCLCTYSCNSIAMLQKQLKVIFQILFYNIKFIFKHDKDMIISCRFNFDLYLYRH